MAQDIAEKVGLLLAKAEATDNPAEAEAYTRKAEELMLKHNIDQAMVASKRPGSKVDEIVMVSIPTVSQYNAALVTYGGVVAASFNLKAYTSLTTGKGASAPSWIWLVGHQSDVYQAVPLVQSLLVQAEHAMRYWWGTEGRDVCGHLPKSRQYAARREFFFAFASGARQRLMETRNRVVQESGTGTDLVLRDRASVVDEWTKNNVSTTKSMAGRVKGGDWSARVAGHAAGREAVGQRSVSS